MINLNEIELRLKIPKLEKNESNGQTAERSFVPSWDKKDQQ